MSDDGHELITELKTQVRCSYGRGLNSPNHPLGYATARRLSIVPNEKPIQFIQTLIHAIKFAW